MQLIRDDPMLICATVKNWPASHQVEVRTGDTAQSLLVQPKATGRGSSINGGFLGRRS